MNMKKLNEAYIALLNEGEEKATELMRSFVLETCKEINTRIIREEDTDFDVMNTEVESTDPVYLLTVAYRDEDGGCAFDSAITTALGVDDVDGAGWANGIRTLIFQFSTEEEANKAQDTLVNDNDSDLPEDLDTDVSEFNIGDETEETEEIEEDNSTGQESPLSDTRPECNSELEEEELETEVEPVEVETETETTDFSDIFSDPNESDSDKILDLAAEIEELKAMIDDALASKDDDLEESYSLEAVKPLKNKDGEELDGGTVKQNDVSPIAGNNDIDNRAAGAKPIEIHSEDDDSFALQKAPPVKELNLGTNVRDCVFQGMEAVSKEGDKSALINKTIGTENDNSIISGKMK